MVDVEAGLAPAAETAKTPTPGESTSKLEPDLEQQLPQSSSAQAPTSEIQEVPVTQEVGVIVPPSGIISNITSRPETPVPQTAKAVRFPADQ